MVLLQALVVIVEKPWSGKMVSAVIPGIADGYKDYRLGLLPGKVGYGYFLLKIDFVFPADHSFHYLLNNLDKYFKMTFMFTHAIFTTIFR